MELDAVLLVHENSQVEAEQGHDVTDTKAGYDQLIHCKGIERKSNTSAKILVVKHQRCQHCVWPKKGWFPIQNGLAQQNQSKHEDLVCGVDATKRNPNLDVHIA